MTLQDLGQTIREKREASGLSIEDIAGKIKVSARALRAIEDGSLKGLPHAVYTKGFVRSFASIVGVDAEELDNYMKRLFPPEAFDDAKPEPGPLARPLTPPGMGKKIAVLVLLVVVLIGAIAGGWYVFVTYGDEIVKRVKQPFSAIKTLPDGINATVPSGEATALSVLEGTPSITSSSTSATGMLSGNTLVSSTPASPPSLASPPASSSPPGMAMPATPTVSAQGEAPQPPLSRTDSVPSVQQVLISARSPCWVSAKADGSTGRQYTVKAGEEFTLTFKKSIEIVLGNPSAVDVTYNGKPYIPEHAPNQRAKFTLP